MALAIVIFGASGSGKSTLMDALTRAGKQYSVHMKTTDRPPRKYDGIEIRCMSEVNESDYDYIYQTYGYRYFLQRRQIDEALSAGQHHFIICNEISVIRAMKRDYGDRLRIVCLWFDAPRQILEHIQREREISDDEIELRLKKMEGLFHTFRENYDLFDDLLINHFGDSPSQLRELMEKILAKMVVREKSTTETSITQIVKQLSTHLDEIKASPTTPIEADYAFIIMAMNPAQPDLEDVHAAIKRACHDVNVRAERVDDTEFTGQITAKVLSSIRIAEFVIADLSHERPNVYYEVGFADALGKPLLLVARRGSTIHFDLQGLRVLYYDNLVQLETSLKKWIRGLRALPR